MFKRIGCLVVGLVIFLTLLGFSSYNSLVEREEAVRTAWSQVQNVYQRRADLVPNLVETVQGAASFERETLEAVVEARSRATGVTLGDDLEASDLERFRAAQTELTGALGRLLAVAERYPDLSATEAFRDLQAQLEGTESRIAVERRRFNEAAREYNTFRRRIPNALFAPLLGFDERPYFEAEGGAEQAPNVDFRPGG